MQKHRPFLVTDIEAPDLMAYLGLQNAVTQLSLTFNAQDTHSETRGQVQGQLDTIRMDWQSGHGEAKSTQVELSKTSPNANKSVFILLLIILLFKFVSVCYQIA